MNIVGYGICGQGEADKYLKKTLDCFKRLCDDTIILLCNSGKKEKEMIESYGFKTVEDNREWGKNQWKIKQDFVKNEVSKLNPDVTICLDMDEEYINTREEIEEFFQENKSAHVFIVNLWGLGYKKKLSFWNVRAWSWKDKDKLGDQFYEWEQKGVHCGLAPKWAYFSQQYSPFVVKHYGLKKKEDRLARVERYKKYDPEQKLVDNPSYYKELEDISYDKMDIESIQSNIREEVENINQPVVQPIIRKPKDVEYIKREHDGLIFTVDKGRVKNQLSQTYMFKGKKYGFTKV